MKLSRYKRESNFSYALGATLVYELIKCQPELITRIFLRPNIPLGEDLLKILDLARQKEFEIAESAKAFNILGAKPNCLLAAEFKKPDNHLDATSNSPHLVLVNPSDAGNLGTIMRSAAAFNYADIAIIAPSVDPYQPKVIRSSMGAIFHLHIEEFENIDAYLARHQNRERYAFMLNSSAKKLSELKIDHNNYALFFGNEASGLPKEYADLAQTIFIPQSQNVDSLNLSIAVSIALYEINNN